MKLLKRFSLGLSMLVVLLVGGFLAQPQVSFAHTTAKAIRAGIGGGTLNRAIWTSPQTLGFSVSDITTGFGEVDVLQYATILVGETRFFSDSNGNAVGELFVNGCDNLSVRVFDGQAGTIYTIPIPSCSTFAPAPYGPDTCLDGYVWREAYGSNDHVCVVPATRSQAAYDNSQASSRIDPNGAYGPDTCINGYVWREASKGIDDSILDHVCVTPATRSQAAYDNSQAPYLKLFP